MTGTYWDGPQGAMGRCISPNKKYAGILSTSRDMHCPNGIMEGLYFSKKKYPRLPGTCCNGPHYYCKDPYNLI